jgi:hypothetical protein
LHLALLSNKLRSIFGIPARIASKIAAKEAVLPQAEGKDLAKKIAPVKYYKKKPKFI